jgi:hypothetical protein
MMEITRMNQWRGGSAPLSILQIGGISAKNEADQCASALCLSELHITLASPPLAAFTKLARHSSGRLHWAFHWRDWISSGANSLVTLKVGLTTTKTILTDFLNGIQSWVTSLYTAL